jgi:hypothetical protein
LVGLFHTGFAEYKKYAYATPAAMQRKINHGEYCVSIL